MKKIVASDKGLKEADSPLTGRRYKADKNGVFSVSDRDAKKMIEWGCFYQPVAGVGKRHQGYRCQACDFGSWFTKCSRCGGECKRES